jgi:Tfp pilus assembly protein FimT
MTAAARLKPRWRSRGVTLMELLLVLVLLVIAGSLTIPAITGAFSSVRLRRAGDAVMARWAEARAQAIETGMPYQFRFTPDSGTYRLEPWSAAGGDQPVSPNSSIATSATQLSGSAATTAPVPATSQSEANSDKPDTPATHQSLDQTPTIEAQLPDTILFQGGQAAVDDALSGERRVDTLQSPNSTWSSPVLFFPDGSASQATVVLTNDVGQFLRVTLRGLTGVARASTVMTREELDKSSDTR